MTCQIIIIETLDLSTIKAPNTYSTKIENDDIQTMFLFFWCPFSGSILSRNTNIQHHPSGWASPPKVMVFKKNNVQTKKSSSNLELILLSLHKLSYAYITSTVYIYIYNMSIQRSRGSSIEVLQRRCLFLLYAIDLMSAKDLRQDSFHVDLRVAGFIVEPNLLQHYNRSFNKIRKTHNNDKTNKETSK